MNTDKDAYTKSLEEANEQLQEKIVTLYDKTPKWISKDVSINRISYIISNVTLATITTNKAGFLHAATCNGTSEEFKLESIELAKQYLEDMVFKGKSKIIPDLNVIELTNINQLYEEDFKDALDGENDMNNIKGEIDSIVIEDLIEEARKLGIEIV